MRSSDWEIQVERSSSSVCDNIAEGYTTYYYNDKIKGFNIARKEAGETQNHVRKMSGKNYLSAEQSQKWVERYEESLALAEQLIHKSKKANNVSWESWGYWGAARAHIRLGNEIKAQEFAVKFLKLRPDHSLEKDRRNSSYKSGVNEQEYEDMRKAGIPEHSPEK